MLPIVIDPGKVSVALVGSGDLLVRRANLLQAANVRQPKLFVIGDVPEGLEGARTRLPNEHDLKGVSVLFIAGLEHDQAVSLTLLARSMGVLVNTEDDRELCDFHVPASVRRGELLLTASTGGGAPGLARRLRQKLEGDYGNEWAEHVRELSEARLGWRQEGYDFAQVARESDQFIDQKGWLK